MSRTKSPMTLDQRDLTSESGSECLSLEQDSDPRRFRLGSSCSSVAIAIALLLPGVALAEGLGKVTQALRPTLRTFDAHGQPLGQIKAGDLHLPTPIVGHGVGNSIGVHVGTGVVYLRGLDVQTEGMNATCKPVQTAARPAGSSYATSNMGLGGAADCRPAAR